MRIAIDIDSTLHHYWDVLSDAARRRFGIELPYEEQFTWGITRLREEQLRCCIDETHSDEVVLAGRPYPGAVETVNRWHAAGHFIHITSHRHGRSFDATEQWLRNIGLAFDELYLSFDKVARCREIGMDLLIDDSPVNLTRALEEGIDETNSDEVVLAARPYPGAVETVNRWHAAGHFIHITSHRHGRSFDATERWLRNIGLAFDELYLSFDKVARCREVGIDLLIDDSPVNLTRALEEGIAVATILHPWNEDVCEVEQVVCGRTWDELAVRLEPLLARGGDTSRAA